MFFVFVVVVLFLSNFEFFFNLFFLSLLSFTYIFRILKKWGNECAHFKTLFLQTGVRVRAEIVWGSRISVVKICLCFGALSLLSLLFESHV